MSTCPCCRSELVPQASFKVSREDSAFLGKMLCQGCFRSEEYRETNTNPYGSHTSGRRGRPIGPSETR